jgi:hypothetical protein
VPGLVAQCRDSWLNTGTGGSVPSPQCSVRGRCDKNNKLIEKIQVSRNKKNYRYIPTVFIQSKHFLEDYCSIRTFTQHSSCHLLQLSTYEKFCHENFSVVDYFRTFSEVTSGKLRVCLLNLPLQAADNQGDRKLPVWLAQALRNSKQGITRD